MALFLIDGHALAYRSYFALGGAALRNSRGEETGAVYGFLNTLLALDQKYHPEHLAVVFDSDGKTFRHERYDAYKANRPARPDGLKLQFPVIMQALDAMRVRRMEMPGYEADDIIATLVRRWSRDVAVQIVSADKDLLQLVSDHVHVIRPGKTSVLENELDPAALEAQLGLRASQIVDYLALVGDTSDNVPGVRGIGEKTAVELLARFGTLAALYERLHEVEKAGVRKRLEEGRADAMQSRDLVVLHDDVPVEIELAELARPDFRTPELERMLVDLEFRRMREQLFSGRERADVPRAAPAAAPAPAAVTARAVATAVAVPVRYTAVTDEAALRDLALHLATLDEIAVDTETSALDPVRAVLAGIAIATAPGDAYYIPVASDIHDETPGLLPLARAAGLPLETVRDALAPVFAAALPRKVGQHIKYDAIVLARAGLPLSGVAFDTMLASYCLDPARRSHGLDALALEVCGHTMIPFEALFDTRVRVKDIRRVALPRVVEYACEDADYTLRVKHAFAPLIEVSEVRGLFEDVEMPLSDVLARMEMTGVKVDTEFLSVLSRRYSERVISLEESIYREAGERFNLGSTQKLRDVLFEKLKLTPGGAPRPASRPTRTCSRSWRPAPGARGCCSSTAQLTKLKSTYVDALPRLVNPETGRVHTSFNQTVAATGRLSARSPNLQNIPIRTAAGPRDPPRLRRARPGWRARRRRLLADRAAHDGAPVGRPGAAAAFREGEDVHARTAPSIFGVRAARSTPELRARAKVVNFGIMYGMGARGLAAAARHRRWRGRAASSRTTSRVYAGVQRLPRPHHRRGARATAAWRRCSGRRRCLPELASAERRRSARSPSAPPSTRPSRARPPT